MKLYGLIQDNEIVTLTELPKAKRGWSKEQLNHFGWYEVNRDNSQPLPWQTVSTSYEITENGIDEVKSFTDMSLEDYKDKKYSQLRNEVKQFIFENYPEYKQLSALAGFYDETENARIKDGVKYYFDIATKMKDDLYAMTSYEDVDAVYLRKNTAEDMDSEPNYVYWGE